MRDQEKVMLLSKLFKADPISYRLHRVILISPKQKR